MKLIGAMLLVISSALLSVTLCTEARRRVRAAASLHAMMLFITNRVECFLQPVDTILLAYENDFLEECGFLPEVRQHGLSAALDRVHFNTEYDSALRRFAEQSGGGYKTEQLALCREFADFFREKADSAAAALPGRLKMGAGLPPLAAVSILLMLM